MDSSTGEYEYAIHNATIMIPRVVDDKLANEAINVQLSSRTPEVQRLWQEGSRLRLDMGRLELLDTFQFVHDKELDSIVTIKRQKLKSRRWVSTSTISWLRQASYQTPTDWV